MKYQFNMVAHYFAEYEIEADSEIEAYELAMTMARDDHEQADEIERKAVFPISD